MKQQNNVEYRGLTNKDRQDLVSLFKGDYLPKELQEIVEGEYVKMILQYSLHMYELNQRRLDERN
jgi:hypothetical protein